MFSASAAQRVEVCPASEVLPQVFNVSEAANKGSAGHEHMALRASHGVDYAVEKLDATIAKHNLSDRDAAILRSRLLKFEWSPPVGSIREVRLALMQDWTVVRVPDDQRYYPGALFTGQLDIAWAEPHGLVFGDGPPQCPPSSVLFVADYKFGKDSWVHSIEANLQIAIYAYLAARWTGAQNVVPAVIFPGEGEGEWDTVQRPWVERDLQQVEDRIRGLLAGVERNRVKLADGAPLDLTEGRHCEYCAARSRCPAKTAMFKRVADGDAPLGNAPLTPEQARYLATALPQFSRFARELREALEDYVRENGPIPIEDGVVFGPMPVRKDVVLSEPARSILLEELGPRYAEEALKTQISKSSIADAIKAMLEEKGIKRRGKATIGRVLGKLRSVGALVPQNRVEWCAHRPTLPAMAQASYADIEGFDE